MPYILIIVLSVFVEGSIFRNINFQPSLLLKQQQKFYNNEFYQSNLNKKSLEKINQLFNQFLKLKSKFFLNSDNNLLAILQNFKKRINKLNLKVNKVYLKVLLVGMQSYYFANQIAPKNLSFKFKDVLEEVNNLSSFISFLVYKNFFDLKKFFPESEWNDDYNKNYILSIAKLLDYVTEENERVIYHEISYFINKHYFFLNENDKIFFINKIDSLENKWLSKILNIELFFAIEKDNNQIFFNSSKKAKKRVFLFSQKTKKEKRKFFEKRLFECIKLRSSYPENEVLMLKLIRKFRLYYRQSSLVYFRDGIKKEFDYWPLYEEYKNHLDSIAKIHFVLECYLTKRFDTFIPSISLFYNFSFIQKGDIIENLFEDILKGYQLNKVNYYQNNNQFLESYLFDRAFKLKKYSYAYKIANRSENELINYSTLGFKKSIKEKIRFVKAVKEIDDSNYRFQNLYDDINWDTSFPKRKDIEDIKSLLEEINIIEQDKKISLSTKVSLKNFKNILLIEQNFYKGDWVELKFQKDLSLWRLYRGKFLYQDENTVIGTSNLLEGIQYLAHRVFFQAPYEIEMNVLLEDNYLKSKILRGGFIIGKMHSKIFGRHFYVDSKNKGGIYNPYEKDKKNIKFLKLKSMKEYKLRVEIYPKSFKFWINDQKVPFMRKKNFAPLLVSIGSFSIGSSGMVIYKNIRIRLLKKK